MNRKTMQRLSKLAAAWIVMIAAFVLTVAYCIGKEDNRR